MSKKPHVFKLANDLRIDYGREEENSNGDFSSSSTSAKKNSSRKSQGQIETKSDKRGSKNKTEITDSDFEELDNSEFEEEEEEEVEPIKAKPFKKPAKTKKIPVTLDEIETLIPKVTDKEVKAATIKKMNAKDKKKHDELVIRTMRHGSSKIFGEYLKDLGYRFRHLKDKTIAELEEQLSDMNIAINNRNPSGLYGYATKAVVNAVEKVATANSKIRAMVDLSGYSESVSKNPAILEILEQLDLNNGSFASISPEKRLLFVLFTAASEIANANAAKRYQSMIPANPQAPPPPPSTITYAPAPTPSSQPIVSLSSTTTTTTRASPPPPLKQKSYTIQPMA